MMLLKTNVLMPAALIAVTALIAVCFITSPQTVSAATSCSAAPNAANGTDSISVNVPTTGTYSVWTRINAPTTNADSLYMQIDGGCAVEVGGSASMSLNTWNWVDYENGSPSAPITMNLSAGNHNVLLTGIGAGLEVDRILFLGDPSCVPSGTGSNCTVITYDKPVVNISAPTSGTTVSGNAVSLAATATDDNSTISSVRFEIDSNVIGTATYFPYSATLNTTNLTDGSHILKVIATNAQGQETSASESFSVANHTCSSPPIAPSNLSASPTGLQTMAIKWSPSTPSSGCSISAYNVYRNNTQIGMVSTTSDNDSGLTPNTAYKYYVTATDNNGHTSAASATVTGITSPDLSAPTAPVGATATAINSSTVKLTWQSASDNVAIAEYRIYRNGTLIATTGPTATSYFDYTATANTSYNYSLSALDTSDNESAKINAQPYTVKTPAATSTATPSPPLNIKPVLETANEVVLEWTAGKSSVKVVGYHVYRNGKLVATVSSADYADTGLTPNTTYKYYVTAFDSNANVSSASPTITASTEKGIPMTSNGDFDNDGKINYIDLSILLSHWGSLNATVNQGDANGDGVVNAADLLILLSNWNAS